MPVRVYPTTRAASFWPISPWYPTYDAKLYTFVDDFTEFPPSAIVFVHSITNTLTSESLYIKIGEGWWELKNWLLTIKYDRDYTDDRKFRPQRKWWKLNGKTFNLLGLPAELRTIIYEHVLGPFLFPACIKTDTSPTVHWGHGIKISGHCDHLYHRNAPVPNVALLQVSKQVYHEASKAGWEGTRRCFLSHRDLEAVLRPGITAPPSKWLNKIILDFSMQECFMFLGVLKYPTFTLIQLDRTVTSSPRSHSWLTCRYGFRAPTMATITVRGQTIIRLGHIRAASAL